PFTRGFARTRRCRSRPSRRRRKRWPSGFARSPSVCLGWGWTTTTASRATSTPVPIASGPPIAGRRTWRHTWGRGCGRAARGGARYTALFGIRGAQGYFKAFAGVTLPNPASVGLHEAIGFERVGEYRGVGYKRGAWHDVRWYQLALQPESPDPEPPR